VDRTRALKAAREYVLTRFRTVEKFDLRAGTWDGVNSELIKSTRVFSSRISKKEEQWFIQMAETAPWNAVPLGSRLIDADPTQRGSLYDDAACLWYHFADAAIRGVARAKISKVLHAMRPTYFPVLDSRLVTSFRELANQAAESLHHVRPASMAYWAAIRQDLLRKEMFLKNIRAELCADECESVRTWSGNVSDVRLHDVLVWSLHA
jgi:hypothetical protein